MAQAMIFNILRNLALAAFQKKVQEMKEAEKAGKEISSLRRSLESIQTVLDDAEQKQMEEKNIKLWLERLKEVCYDVEDLVDELRTAFLKSEVDNAHQDCFSSSSKRVKRPSSNSNSYSRSIVSQIKLINEKLDDIARDKDRYHLVSRDRLHSRRVESTSFVQVSQLHGRDEDQRELIRSLLYEGGEIGDNIVSVVGMGGIGKTALAQLIYNDVGVMNHFDERIWVFVSEPFDLIRIAKAIHHSVNFDPRIRSTENLNSLGLQNLLNNVSHSIKGRKVLLVLDDVWTDQSREWEALKEALKPAAAGSRILVTTQKDTTADAIKSFRVFRLNGLSDDACWKIVRQEAFTGSREFRISEDVGRKLAEKCKGLPLAAKTLGGVLRSKKTRKDWEDVLNCTGSSWTSVQQDVFASLQLSYHDLPSEIKRCFLYCSVYSKGAFIGKDELIRKWMSLGYLNSVNNPELEEIGAEYFDSLVARSFLHSHQVRDGRVGAYMDDTILDFARVLMGNEFSLEEDVSGDQTTKVRHLFTKVIPSAPDCLWSLTISKAKYVVPRNRDLRHLSNRSKRLRSLDFVYGCYAKEFPKEGAKLLHLRLLNLSGSSFKTLPDSICDLCNLQTLYLQECYALEKLPRKMKRLISLRYLDTTKCPNLEYYPKEIGKLTSLRYLRGVVVRSGRGTKKFRLGDLEKLCDLRSLVLIFPDNWDPMMDEFEAGQARLHNMKHLKESVVVTYSEKVYLTIVRALNLGAVTTNIRYESIHSNAWHNYY